MREPTAPTDPKLDAEDVRRAVALAVAALRDADRDAQAWQARAGELDWTCRETLEHLADDLFTYAARFGLAEPPTKGPLPFRTGADRPGAPENAVFADRSAAPAGLLTLVEACGGLLAAALRSAPPGTLSYHVFGTSDPEGFAAMAIVETLVHTHDITQGLHLPWTPPADLCARTLDRLFPHVAPSSDPWRTLLWATGRSALPDRPRLTRWRWYGAPRTAADRPAAAGSAGT
ncbi:maleylpyruvate isomerase N-terminal domain-containing protein [Streptomyces polyrhachis]|uniref:Maleylpyruvate isomerase N-terminal domain-containing protein n=1 Tax=Streptomyces polyrhachis TaxID=1282885 RepID=A0ABW2GIT6_9ACTN